MRAMLHIKSNGKETPLHGAKIGLNEAQAYVGGYIEEVRGIGNGGIMIVNEEGRLENLPLNAVASEIARKQIVGDVLIVEYDKEDLE